MTMRVFVLLAFTFSAAAQAPATFKEGVLAFEKKEWAKAEQLMRDTVAANPKESVGTVSISGQWYETYVPYYFLARALAKQGKCREALEAFAETERQGVSPTIPDFARHLANRGGCKQKVVEVEIPVEGGTRRVDPKPPPPPDPVPAPGPRERAELIETRARLTTAISAYLRGEYELTAQLLAGAKFSNRAAAAEAALFRAAARHALYRMGGEKNEQLRAEVERDLRAYRQLRPNGKPDPRIFPRHFIALVR